LNRFCRIIIQINISRFPRQKEASPRETELFEVAKIMREKSVRFFSLISSLLFFTATFGFGQAVFTVGNSQPTAADIGFTELTGSITLTIISGTSVAAPFVIAYPAAITNNAASEISVTGTGNLAIIAPAPDLDLSANTIRIIVPSGGTAGDRIQISGVRLAVAGSGVAQVKATISSSPAPSNTITVGEDKPMVIGAVKEPFSLDQSADPLTYANGMAEPASTSLTLSEKYMSAFSDAIGNAGQTVPTRIRLTPFPSIPAGAKITFDATASSSETGAVITTLSGSAETVPRADGSTDVTYVFTSMAGSPSTVESFHFGVSLSQIPDSGSGTIRFQAAILPIGATVPNQQFPSTDIPRYAERLVPDEVDLMTGSTELVFPFRKASDDTYTGVAITNPQNFRIRITLTAYDDSGTLIAGNNIINPVTVILPRKGQYAELASQIFGSGFSPSSPGTIRVLGQTTELEGFYITGDNSGPKFDGSTGDIQSAFSWYIPLIFRQGSAPFNLVEIINPGNQQAAITLRLKDENGNQLATATRTLAAGGTFLQDIHDIFGINLDSFQGGYIKEESNVEAVVHGVFGNALESNILPGQLPPSPPLFYVPHFATGGPYSTELAIVNTHASRSAALTLTLLDNEGEPIPIAGNPLEIDILPGAQLKQTLRNLFPALGLDLITGSIRVETKPFILGGFRVAPWLVGAVRFSAADGSASASIPLFLPPSTSFVYSHVAQDLGYFTGVAMMNTYETPASLKLDVYTKDGILSGSYSSVMQPGERFAKLLYQLVPASAGQVGGYIRVTSDIPLTSLSLFGTENLRSLSAIPLQDLN
jgi:hypothetical protein